jgi:hypothetical protein
MSRTRPAPGDRCLMDKDRGYFAWVQKVAISVVGSIIILVLITVIVLIILVGLSA